MVNKYECGTESNLVNDIVHGLNISNFVIVGICSMVAFATTIVIVFFRKSSERPRFVMQQTLAIDIFCVGFIVYFALGSAGLP